MKGVVAAAATVALRPKNEATRQPGQAKRVTTNVINSSASVDNITARRVQFLSDRIGIAATRAGLIAALCVGGRAA